MADAIEIRRIDGFTLSLTQLPNGDLWRGAPVEQADGAATNEDPTVGKTALDAAMSSIVKSSKGPELTCIWCGYQVSKKNYVDMADHVKKQHSSAVAAVPDVAALASLLPANADSNVEKS